MIFYSKYIPLSLRKKIFLGIRNQGFYVCMITLESSSDGHQL